MRHATAILMHLPHDSFKEGAGDTRQECVCVCAHQHLDVVLLVGWWGRVAD